MFINKFKYFASVLDLNIPSYKHTKRYIIFWLSNIRITLMTVSPRSLSSLKKPFLLYRQNRIGEINRVSALVAMLIY